MKQSNISIKKVALTLGVFALVSVVGFGTAMGYGGSTSGGGGISGGSSYTPINTPAPIVHAPIGQVLGAESFHFTLPLKLNAHSDEVTQLQTRLTADGFTLTIDGKFGAKTKVALIKWQTAHSLTADGVVGPLTRAALNA